MKTTIAIIGSTGNMGKGLAHKLAKDPYRLLLFGRDKEKLNVLENEIKSSNPEADIEVISCQKEASWEADIIIPAIPYEAQKEVAEKIKEVVTQKIVVSLANPINETYTDLNTESSAAEELQKLLPNSKIVKAFNTTYASSFFEPVIDDNKVDCFIASSDAEAKSIISNLVKCIGFNPVNAGDLSSSRTLELMQLLMIKMTLQNNYNWKAGWKVLN